MAANARAVRWLAAPLVIAGALGCTRPEAALREQPGARLELILEVPDLSEPEIRDLADRMARGLGMAVLGPDLPEGPHRVFRVTVKGQRNPAEGQGLAATWAATAASGALAGAVVPLNAGAFGLAAVPWGAGAGLVAGLGYGPFVHQSNQHLMATHGYLPWVFTATWEVLERGVGPAQRVVARRDPAYLDLGPYLKPLQPEARSEAGVRQASLRAYADALAAHFREAGTPSETPRDGMLGPARH